MIVEHFGFDEIMQWDDPTWVIEGALQRGATIVISAPSKLGKTLFALRVATSVSTGNDFFGRATRRGKVVYLYAERAETTLKGRVAALHAYGVEVPSRQWLSFVKQPLDFVHTDTDELAEAIGPCDVFFVDTLTTSSGSADIMVPHNMKMFAQGVKKVAKKLNATAIIVHHDHKQGFTSYGKAMPTSYSGPSELINNVDSYIAMWKSDKGIRVQTRSTNGGEDLDMLGKIVPVVISEDPYWADAVFEIEDNPPTDEDAKEEKQEDKKQAKEDKNRPLLRAFMIGRGQVPTADLASLFKCTSANVGRKMKPYVDANDVALTRKKIGHNFHNFYEWIAE